MTTFAVYDGDDHLVSRTRSRELAERLRDACGGRIRRIDREPTTGELLAGEPRADAA